MPPAMVALTVVPVVVTAVDKALPVLSVAAIAGEILPSSTVNVTTTFGTPWPGTRDASNAVACARDLVRDLNRWNREREAAGHWPLRIGVGLHCGEATLGNVGSARRFEHTVVGEIVNLANRIESLTRTLDIAILISDAVVEEV